jgi:type IV secretion system protein VirB10
MINNRMVAELACLTLLGASPATAQGEQSAAPPTAVVAAGDVQREALTIPTGTTLRLVLRTGISTSTTQPGQAIILDVREAVVMNGRTLVPAGARVHGSVQEVMRPGRVGKRGRMFIKLERLILPKGEIVDISTALKRVWAGRGVKLGSDGWITGPSGRRRKAAYVAGSAGIAALTGFGATFGHFRRGIAAGAALGAGVGLASVLGTPGPDLELPNGVRIEAVLQQAIVLGAPRPPS